MLDSRGVEQIRIRTAGEEPDDRVLGHGSHELPGRHGGVRLCLDRRGAWLQVDPDASGVLVNGRPVRRMAMLRIGDTLWLDGREVHLLAANAPGDEGSGSGTPAPRLVLRGVGGHYHGRCITLDRPRTVGRRSDCDIRVDDPAFPERHARLEADGHGVVLEPLGGDEHSLVNGERVGHARLRAGDQVVFDGHHRFVLESPGRPRPARDLPPDEAEAEAPLPVARRGAAAGGLRRLPWLLGAALVLAGLLSLLLLSGGP